MISREHDRIEELLAVRALDALDGGDVATLAAEMAGHGPNCAECRRLEAELNETAAMLAFALDPRPVDASMADRIVAEAVTLPEADRSSSEVGPEPGPADERDEVGERRRRLGRGWSALIAAALALVLVVGVAIIVPAGPTQPVNANWAQSVVRFQGEGGAQLTMAYSPGQTGAVFWGRNLPDPGAGKTLEIWEFEGKTPISAGCVTPADGRVASYEPVDLSSANLMAVTVESADCPAAPTTAPILTAPLTVA
jgi:Anti-sigma-K factor rskA